MTKDIHDLARRRHSLRHRSRRWLLVLLARVMRQEWRDYPIISTETSIQREGVKYTFRAERTPTDEDVARHEEAL